MLATMEKRIGEGLFSMPSMLVPVHDREDHCRGLGFESG